MATTLPPIGFGTWELAPDVAYDAVRTALDAGYRHVDTAQMYGNEEAVGRALRDSDQDRDDVFVTTKVLPSRAARGDVLASTTASLERLGMDHVDLLLIHWPSHAVPVEETVAALDEARERGWTRHIGVSNYPTDLMRRALSVAPLATNQVEYHPFLGQDKVLATCREHGMDLSAYSPLAHGEVVHDETLVEIGRQVGRSAVQVALRWLLDQPDVVVLPRSSDPEHIAANRELDFELSAEQRARIDALPKDRRLIAPPFAPDWD